MLKTVFKAIKFLFLKFHRNWLLGSGEGKLEEVTEIYNNRLKKKIHKTWMKKLDKNISQSSKSIS